MIVAAFILLALVLVGTILYLLDKRSAKPEETAVQAPPPQPSDTLPATEAESQCCGMHITCEKDSLLSSVSDQIVYYDDEELDDYRNRQPDDYTEQEIEQFRDILLTLLPQDIAGWGRSLQLRGIALPSPVRDELLMIVAEARQTADPPPR